MSTELPLTIVDIIYDHAKKCGFHGTPKMHVIGACTNGESFSGSVFRVSLIQPFFDTQNSNNNNNNLNNNNNNQQCDGNSATDTCNSHGFMGRINREIHMIVKVAPAHEKRRQLFKSSKHFNREKYVYEIVLPAFEEFQKQYLCRMDQFWNYPNLIKAHSESYNEFIILNDLRVHGFSSPDRPKPLDFNRCAIVLRNLAKFHAISFALRDQNKYLLNELVAGLDEIIFTDPSLPNFQDFLQKKADNALKTLKRNDDHLVRQKIIAFGKNFSKAMIECTNERDEGAVICHGDCWISNIMFRKQINCRSEEICLIDWQVSRYCSPVVDISYFIFCCTDVNLRRRLPELLQMYHTTLIKRITELGSYGELLYPYEKFERHLKKYMKFGLGMAMMTLHCTTCKSVEMPDVMDGMENFDFLKIKEHELEKKPAYQERMAGVCRDMVRFGYL